MAGNVLSMSDAEKPAERESAAVALPLRPEWALPGSCGPSALDDAVCRAEASIDGLRAAGPAFDDAGARGAVRRVDELLARLESVWLSLVSDLDCRPGAVPGALAGKVAQTFLTHGLNRSPGRAHRDVDAARALFVPSSPTCVAGDGRPGEVALAAVGEAFAAGEVGREHVDVAVRCLQQVPLELARATGGEGVTGTRRVDAYLAENAKVFDPRQLARLGGHLTAVLDPDGTHARDGFDPDAYRRRDVRLHDGGGGMTLGRMQLDPVGAVWVKSALNHFAYPAGQNGSDEPSGSGSGASGGAGAQQVIRVTDDRNQGQRYADALVAVCRLAMDADPATTRREPPHVQVITTAQQLGDARARAAARARVASSNSSTASSTATLTNTPIDRDVRAGGGGCRDVPDALLPAAPGLAECPPNGPLSLGVAGRLACDAILQAVVLDEHGAVLGLGRSQRTASRAQRRALAARDGGCVVPGCEAHRVTFWSAGGSTDIANLALVCDRHHTEIHLGIWRVVMLHDVPHLEPPP